MMSRKLVEEMAVAVNGIPVWGCLPGSTAAAAGVRYGDVVISVNGVPTPTIDEYFRARELRPDGYELRLFRAGSQLDIFVPFRSTSASLASVANQVVEGRYFEPVAPAPVRLKMPA